jgi:hypothetical protein
METDVVNKQIEYIYIYYTIAQKNVFLGAFFIFRIGKLIGVKMFAFQF